MAETFTSRFLAMSFLFCLFFAVQHLLPAVEAVWMTIPSSGTRCVSEDIHSNVVVLGDYVIIDSNVDIDEANHTLQMSTITVKVTSPYGTDLHHNQNVTNGQFAFTTMEAGNYMACFWVESNHKHEDVTLHLDWRIGIAAKDWESVARKDKIDGIVLELTKLDGLVESIHENLVYMRDRERVMREVSEKTNSRVAWLSVISIGICIACAVWQAWHLQVFFHKKKLI